MRVLYILFEIIEEFEALKIGFFKYFHKLLLYVRNHIWRLASVKEVVYKQ